LFSEYKAKGVSLMLNSMLLGSPRKNIT